MDLAVPVVPNFRQSEADEWGPLDLNSAVVVASAFRHREIFIWGPLDLDMEAPVTFTFRQNGISQSGVAGFGSSGPRCPRL